MKKSIGLTADVSTFNTTLPQTRHLNYFMNTNPRGFAKGGDVKAGIPNYPNPNVTSGFLPMALGFAPGGEVKEKDAVTKVYDFVLGYFKNVLGMDDDEAKEKTEETINNSTEEEIENIVQKIPSGPSQEVFDREEEIKGLETPRKPVTPIETVTTTPSDRQPGLDVPLQPLVPSDRQPGLDVPLQPLVPSDRQPGIGIANEMQPNDGITQIEPESKNRFDVNGDGVVNFKDLFEAIRLGMGTKFIEELRQFIEGFKGEEEPDKDKKIVPDSPEKIIPEGPNIDKEREIKESEEQEDKKEIKPELKIKPQPDSGGITGSGRGTDLGGLLETQRRKSDAFTKEDQKTLKIASDIEAGGDGGIETLKNKKDVPAWALPMMSAGFAMMASKSPYFMQALGEAGQAGVESYTAQKTAEEDRLDRESKRDLEKAQAAYYKGEGKQSAGTMKIIDGVYHRYNTTTGTFDKVYLEDGKTPAKVTIGRQDAIDYLMNKDPLWNSYDYDTKEQKIKEYVDMINGTYEQIIKKKETEGDGTFNILDLPKNIFKFIEGFTAKDGGIVSLRR